LTAWFCGSSREFLPDWEIEALSRRDLEVRGASKNRAPAGPLDEACAGERTLAGQLSAAWNLEIENKLAKQIESFVG
jgi:hypothetical protein